MPLSTDERARLAEHALAVREAILEIVRASGSGHVGTALGQTDVLVTLYDRVLRFDADRPDWPERDRFVLSKGHGGIGLVPILADAGFIPHEELPHFGESGHRLGMHMDHHKVPGLECSTGSLGHGLGQAVGMALGAKIQGQAWRTFCLVSDGELYEGSTWEAILGAPSMGLGRLTLIVDRNRLTMDGATEELVPLEPIDGKLAAFGWRVARCDGHDLDAIADAFDAAAADEASGKPAAIVFDTVKGRGVSFMENDPRWHYGALDSDDLERARASIRESEGAGAGAGADTKAATR